MFITAPVAATPFKARSSPPAVNNVPNTYVMHTPTKQYINKTKEGAAAVVCSA